jgi:hypothetical protein
MHCGVRLHGRNACYVIFWNIAPKYMDRGYCNSFYFYRTNQYTFPTRFHVIHKYSFMSLMAIILITKLNEGKIHRIFIVYLFV